MTPAGAAAQDLELQAGTALIRPAGAHALRNVGASRVTLLVVELRSGAAPEEADPNAGEE